MFFRDLCVLAEDSHGNGRVGRCGESIPAGRIGLAVGLSVWKERPFRGYAPADAYLEGAENPYYGSENPWDVRFFTDHIENLS